MTTTQEALKMAIEALENIAFEYGNLLDGEQDYGLLPSETNEDIIIAYRVKRLCQEALEQQEQEPVAWLKDIDNAPIQTYDFADPNEKGAYPVYTHPAKRLNDDEIKHIGATIFACKLDEVNDADIDFARAIEAAIRGK